MDIIGKRIRVQVGGNHPGDDNENKIIGDDTLVFVPSKDAHKYKNIVGEQVSVSTGSLDSAVTEISKIIEQSNIEEREEILSLCRKILNDNNGPSKIEKIKDLIQLGSNIASISSLVIQLCQYIK